MKYLNIAFLAVFAISMISCGGEKAKNTAIEDAEKVQVKVADEILEIETDETEYLEAAMTSLENGDTASAASEIMNAIESIKSYMEEMDDTSVATTAITELTRIVTILKSGTVITADELQKSIQSLELFSDDELEIDEEEIEEEFDEELES